jgi:hypothetical protein
MSGLDEAQARAENKGNRLSRATPGSLAEELARRTGLNRSSTRRE